MTKRLSEKQTGKTLTRLLLKNQSDLGLRSLCMSSVVKMLVQLLYGICFDIISVLAAIYTH